MMPVKIIDTQIEIKNINKSDFPVILSWYNQTEKYKYATGLDHPITLEQLWEKYLETLVNTQEFYLNIYLANTDTIIGNIRGRIGYDSPNQCWISSILVDEQYQDSGLGSRALNLLMEDLKARFNITDFYTSIIVENTRGINFWYKNGFDKVRVSKDFFKLNGKDLDALIMYKRII